jgi:hypothetical protein
MMNMFNKIRINKLRLGRNNLKLLSLSKRNNANVQSISNGIAFVFGCKPPNAPGHLGINSNIAIKYKVKNVDIFLLFKLIIFI